MRSVSRRKTYFVINVIVISGFALLLGHQYVIQFLSGHDNEKMRNIYDKRLRLIENRTKKGTIYDRSGISERALALSIKDSLDNYFRNYLLDSSSVHLVGYSDKKRGKAGIESFFAGMLAGNTVNSVKNLKQVITNKFLSLYPKGQDLYTTIDSRLQRLSFEALGNRKGAVVVMEPHSGEILALVSTPAFSPYDVLDDDRWSNLTKMTDQNPLFNRAIHGLYPPGSIFKMIVASSALEENMAPKYTSGPNGFKPKFASNPIRENEHAKYLKMGKAWPGHGKLSMTRAMQKSSNVYFAKLGIRLGAKKLSEIVTRYGMNRTIEWNTASSQLAENYAPKVSYFPSEDTLRPEEVGWSSLGQYKVLVSPLHVALMTAVIANGGKLVKPSIELGRYQKVAGRPISANTAKKLRIMLRNVVASGTGYRVNLPGLKVAGKTGTAETGRGIPHSWFTSFAPFDDPNLVVVALVENGGYGGVAAAQVVKKIYLGAAKYGYFLNKMDNPDD